MTNEEVRLWQRVRVAHDPHLWRNPPYSGETGRIVGIIPPNTNHPGHSGFHAAVAVVLDDYGKEHFWFKPYELEPLRN